LLLNLLLVSILHNLCSSANLKLSLAKAKERQDLQQRRIQEAKKAQQEEAHTYITRENMEGKITADLFTKPTSTGLVNKYSDYWRYHVLVPTISRYINDPFFHEDSEDGDGKDIVLTLPEEDEVQHRIEAETFLHSMIDNPESREKFDDVVEQFMEMSQADRMRLKELEKRKNARSALFDKDMEDSLSESGLRGADQRFMPGKLNALRRAVNEDEDDFDDFDEFDGEDEDEEDELDEPEDYLEDDEDDNDDSMEAVDDDTEKQEKKRKREEDIRNMFSAMNKT
jgi:hypothetical protein